MTSEMSFVVCCISNEFTRNLSFYLIFFLLNIFLRGRGDIELKMSSMGLVEIVIIRNGVANFFFIRIWVIHNS